MDSQRPAIATQNAMRTPKHKILARFTVLSMLLLPSVGCSSSTDALTTDAVMIARWQSEQAALEDLVAACDQTQETYDLAERYQKENGLIATAGLAAFEGCDVESGLKHLAKSNEGETYLLVTDQYRRGTGWIEERASNWSGGWVSWKSAILEEKGFLYIPQGESAIASVALPRLSIGAEPLDQFVGEYRGTSQIIGNSSCELWKLRPIEPNWYLFYHQSRECPT